MLFRSITGSNPFIATQNSLTLQTNLAYFAIANPNQMNTAVFNNGTTPVTISGKNYVERASAMIAVWSRTHPVGGSLKVIGPYYWCKIYNNVERQYAIQQLDSIFDYVQANKSLSTLSSDYDSSNSTINFDLHSVMHGYLLTKNYLDNATKSRVLAFIEGWDITRYLNGAATLNMRMLSASSLFLAAEEWPNITDSLGHTAAQAIAATKPFILQTLAGFFHEIGRAHV